MLLEPVDLHDDGGVVVDFEEALEEELLFSQKGVMVYYFLDVFIFHSVDPSLLLEFLVDLEQVLEFVLLVLFFGKQKGS